MQQRPAQPVRERVIEHLQQHVHFFPPSISLSNFRISASSAGVAFFKESACMTSLGAEPANTLFRRSPITRRCVCPSDTLALYTCDLSASSRSTNPFSNMICKVLSTLE